MRYAIVENGIVINTAVAVEPIAENWVADPSDAVAPGDTWDGTQFVRPVMPEPEPVVPESVTRAQGKAALIQADLMPGVLAFVSSIADPKDRALAEVTMNDTDVWRRDNAFLTNAAHSLGLSDAQIDELFVTAAGIEL